MQHKKPKQLNLTKPN